MNEIGEVKDKWHEYSLITQGKLTENPPHKVSAFPLLYPLFYRKSNFFIHTHKKKNQWPSNYNTKCWFLLVQLQRWY